MAGTSSSDNKAFVESMFYSTLLDANSFSDSKNIAQLEASIQNADYFAMDTEFGLLGKSRGINNVEEFYNVNREKFLTASLFQIGLTCIKYEIDPESNKTTLKFNSFSIYVIPRSDEEKDTFVLMNPSCLQFLAQHKFDFNRAFGSSIEYERPVDSATSNIDGSQPKESKNSEFDMKKMFAVISQTGKPLIVHQGLHDVIYLYNNFFSVLPNTIDDFRKEFSKALPKVYDTKYLAKKLLDPETPGLESTHLGTLYQFLMDGMNPLDGISYFAEIESDLKNVDDSRAHDAAYDSFMTAMVFMAFDVKFKVPKELENKLYSRFEGSDFTSLTC